MQGSRTRLVPAPGAQQTRIGAVNAVREIAPRRGPAFPNRVRAWVVALPVRSKVVGGAVALVVVFGIAGFALRSGSGSSCPSVVALDDDVRSYSFGHVDAQVECGSSVKFGFMAAASRRVLLHYQASGAVAGTNLDVRLNGNHLAWARAAKGEEVLPVPDRLLRTDAGNIVSFVQADSDKAWSVAKVRAEILAVAPGDPKAAREAYERGRRKLEERNVAPRNLYDAWKSFTAARRYLEGVDPKPPLHAEVAQLIKDTERDLDKDCARLLFAAGRLERYGQDDKAQRVYRETLLRFPAEDPSGCRGKARSEIVSETSAAQ
ncbi:MAG: hypothetical protein ACJ79T_05945 [Myxococcales bacterium]